MQQSVEKPVVAFTPGAITLHWVVAAAMVPCVLFGVTSVYADTNEVTRASLVIHQSIGAVIFAVAFVRLYWRATRPVPALPAAMSASQKFAAAATHWLLYVSLFAFPITGYLSLAARGRSISMFGLFDLPLLVPRSLGLSANSRTLHDLAQYPFYALIALHIAAALYHHFVLKDGILGRMWWRRADPQSRIIP